MELRRNIQQFVTTLGYDLARLAHSSRLARSERYPPGHFYSAVPSVRDITKRASTIFLKSRDIRAIDLNTARQVQILKEFTFMEQKPSFYSGAKARRFDIENDSFSYDDAPVLHYMMRRLRPKRVIEIGSGHSSACMLDTSEVYLNDSVEFTFIDVNCDNLRQNLLEGDRSKVEILERPVQDVDLTLFSTLQKDDLLFIDSSHVMKTGSDLHTIFFEVLPTLAPGVCVHFHDVRYPFEYQRSMLMKGVFWNEAYLLRAFLSYNEAFEITFWLNYLINLGSPDVVQLLTLLPLAEWDRRFNNSAKDFSSAGGSIYITKTR